MVVRSKAGASGTGELGSGVIVDSQGDILTALHVVRGASTIEVTLRRRDDVAGHCRLVGREPRHRGP